MLIESYYKDSSKDAVSSRNLALMRQKPTAVSMATDIEAAEFQSVAL
jgi:hypothetical protein